MPVPGSRLLKAEALFTGLRRADYHHAGGIRCLERLRLDPVFFEALSVDVGRLCAFEMGSDVTKPGHVTHWTQPVGAVTQFSLLNSTGRYDDTSTDHELSCLGKSFHGREDYPTLARFVAAFPHAVNCRINVLGAGAELGPHEENVVVRTKGGGVGARLRLHVPVFTNPAAEMTLDGAVYFLRAGSLFLVNHGCVHSARNGGSEPRVHIVLDVLLTRELFGSIFGSGASPLPGTLLEGDGKVTPRRLEASGPYRRLPRLVAAADAEALDWCDIQ